MYLSSVIENKMVSNKTEIVYLSNHNIEAHKEILQGYDLIITNCEGWSVPLPNIFKLSLTPTDIEWGNLIKIIKDL